MSQTKEKLYLQKVRENWFYLSDIPVSERTEAICLEAVKRNGLALQFIEKQTEEMCLQAIHLIS